MERQVAGVVKVPRKHDVYIGRSTKWGNPFIIGRDGTREEVIAKFREYGQKVGLDKKARAELKGLTLACHCKPLPCHGDVLLEWANNGEDDGN